MIRSTVLVSKLGAVEPPVIGDDIIKCCATISNLGPSSRGALRLAYDVTSAAPPPRAKTLTLKMTSLAQVHRTSPFPIGLANESSAADEIAAQQSLITLAGAF